MEFELKFLPWPGLHPWLGGLAVLLPAFAAFDAWRSGRRILAATWALVVPAAAVCVYATPDAVHNLVAGRTQIPPRMLWVLGVLTYLSLQSYSRSTRRLAFWKKLGLWTLRLAALLLGFTLLVRPVFTWETSGTKYGAVVWVFDVSASMYDVKDIEADGETISRGEAVERVLKAHADKIEELVPDGSGDGPPRQRVFLFGQESRELPWSVAREWKIWSGYPGTAEAAEAAARDPKNPDKGLGRASTAITDALDRVCQTLPQEMFTAVVLVSDGNDNGSVKRAEEVARQLKTLGLNGARLHTLAVGRGATPKYDRSIEPGEVRAPEVVSTNTVVNAECDFTFRNLGGRTAIFQMLVDGSPAGAETKVEIPAGQKVFKHRAAGSWTAGDSDRGRHKVTLRATVKADPPGGDDDRRLAEDLSRTAGEKDVLVERREFNILYVDRIRPESRFVADAIARAADFRLDRARVGDRLRGDELPGSLEDWLRYDVVVLGDIPASAIPLRQQRDLAAAVRDHGRGLLVMGGWRAFGAGGYVYPDGGEADAPLAALLPVRCRTGDGHLEGPLRMLPTAEGLRDGPCALTAAPRTGRPGDVAEVSPVEELRLWRSLPGLEGANRLPYIKPRADGAPDQRWSSVKVGATVFAVSDTDGEAALLVGGRRGKGRVLALAVDSTWKWVLRPGTAAEADRTRDLHARLWRQMIAWLFVPRPSVRFSMDPVVYSLEELRGRDRKLKVSAVLQNFSARQAADVKVSARLYALPEKPADGRTAPDPPTSEPVALGAPVELARSGTDTWAAEVGTDPWKAGAYEVRLEVTGLPKEVVLPAAPTVNFRVVDRDVSKERLDAGARPEFLERLAADADERVGDLRPGDGRSYTLETFPALLDALKAGIVEHTRKVRHTKDIMDPRPAPDAPARGVESLPYGPWLLFAACTIALTLEWILRKAWGLV